MKRRGRGQGARAGLARPLPRVPARASRAGAATRRAQVPAVESSHHCRFREGDDRRRLRGARDEGDLFAVHHGEPNAAALLARREERLPAVDDVHEHALRDEQRLQLGADEDGRRRLPIEVAEGICTSLPVSTPAVTSAAWLSRVDFLLRLMASLPSFGRLLSPTTTGIVRVNG